jgi:DNA-binding CsgD family transcriptional regulator
VRRQPRGQGGAFIEDVKKLTQLLTPQLARNTRAQPHVLASLGRYGALSCAVSRLPDAYFALDAQGAILDHNPAALEILKGSRDSIAVRNQRLTGVDAGIRTALTKALAWCASHRGGAGSREPAPPPILFYRGPDRVPIAMRIVPVARALMTAGLTEGPVAIVWLVDTGLLGGEVECLRKMFRLTQGEARLTEALADGASLVEAASRVDITRSTAKSHLDAIFAKTGCRRQAQLVRLIACLRGLA